ncbi:PIR protein [Plasmodium vivax]|uniref:VIR protein n=1 Tax=Plasmodium vivax TaxID=5855 RepID=A0A565A686_PLAVI|nr:PIR protein [Plasmodium vivax]
MHSCLLSTHMMFGLKKEEKRADESVISAEAWEIVESLWDRLKGNNSFSCKRKSHKINMDHKKTCIDFMVYCVNRDELQKYCLQDGDELKDDYCRNFNEYTKNYYVQFAKQVTCLRDTNKDIHYNWKFSDTCTLQNMAKTFPKYDPSSQKIVDDTSRNPINKCEDPGDSRTINCYMLGGVPVRLEELSTTSNVNPLKYGIYVGSSFLGFISLGLYLYKVNKLQY